MYLFLAAIGIIFLFLEFRKSNIFNLTFACSFIFTAIFWYKYTSNFMYIFVFFCLSSFIFYCLIKGILIKEKSEIEKRKNISNLIGKKAIVKKDINRFFSIDGIGVVEVDSTDWQAKNITSATIIMY